jgi:hypothetical protein
VVEGRYIWKRKLMGRALSCPGRSRPTAADSLPALLRLKPHRQLPESVACWAAGSQTTRSGQCLYHASVSSIYSNSSALSLRATTNSRGVSLLAFQPVRLQFPSFARDLDSRHACIKCAPPPHECPIVPLTQPSDHPFAVVTPLTC